jgi:hypothetical protein
MKRALVATIAVLVPASAVAAKTSPGLPVPRPAAGTFSGMITSATGRYAGDHGHVVINDGPMSGYRGGRLLISGRACHGAGHCLALSGTPSGAMTPKGHPLPDTGFTYTVRATGRVSPLGRVSVSGLLQVPGFVACPHQTLTLTLAGAHGTVRITAETPAHCGGLPA